MKANNNRKNKESYYIGWGVAWGTVVGALLGFTFRDYLEIIFFMSIACGAGIGGAYGKKKLEK